MDNPIERKHPSTLEKDQEILTLLRILHFHPLARLFSDRSSPVLSQWQIFWQVLLCELLPPDLVAYIVLPRLLFGISEDQTSNGLYTDKSGILIKLVPHRCEPVRRPLLQRGGPPRLSLHQ